MGVNRVEGVDGLIGWRRSVLRLCGFGVSRKYEEICAPQVEEFCYITDSTYCREEVGPVKW